MICSDIWHKYHSGYFKIVSNFTRLTASEITCNNFEISLVVFMPNVTTYHATTYTNKASKLRESVRAFFLQLNIVIIELCVLLKWVSVKSSLTVVRLR